MAQQKQIKSRLCEDCNKNRLFFPIGYGKGPFWCDSCRKARFRNPVLKIKLKKFEHIWLNDLMNRAKCKELANFRSKYNPKNGEFSVIKI